ncbi:MAG: ABC transporter permease [Anaerolineaceae bacterium]|nr:MAG: ABC transporter permease [Anaerolineaceae bacterium]
MDALGTLSRLTRIEILKFWRKSTARVVLLFLFVGPILGEAALASFSIRDATFPQITQFMFSSDMLMLIALMMVVVSVMALGNDYELGTVTVVLSRGVDRYQFILSKIIATVSAALTNGFVFMISAFVSTYVVHVTYSDVPFVEAAGGDIVWRLIGAIGVIGLVNFVLSGVVMLALVLGRNSWVGMLAGLGYFFGDFIVGVLGSGEVLGVNDAYRYTVVYHAISINELFFPSDPAVSLPRAWIEDGLATPLSAVIVLILYGAILAVLSILLFHRQDLTTKT